MICATQNQAVLIWLNLKASIWSNSPDNYNVLDALNSTWSSLSRQSSKEAVNTISSAFLEYPQSYNHDAFLKLHAFLMMQWYRLEKDPSQLELRITTSEHWVMWDIGLFFHFGKVHQAEHTVRIYKYMAHSDPHSSSEWKSEHLNTALRRHQKKKKGWMLHRHLLACSKLLSLNARKNLTLWLFL